MKKLKFPKDWRSLVVSDRQKAVVWLASNYSSVVSIDNFASKTKD